MIVPPLVGLGRSTEQEIVPVPLRRLEEWTVHLLGWTETCRAARKERAQVSVMDGPCNKLK